MLNISKTAVALAFALSANAAYAATHAIDARSMGMGNTGVSTADYLTAPFHNPALTAVYREEDDFGLLLPAIGVTANDPDESLALIDDVQDAADAQNASEVQRILAELDNNQPLNVTAGAGAAFAIPNDVLAINVFTGGYVELIADPNVAIDISNGEYDYDQSTVNLVGFGYAEIGVALAKQVELGGQKFSFGVSPKFQELRTYAMSPTIDDFDLDNYDESEISDTAFNFDLGAVWHLDQFRVAMAAKNVLEQEIRAESPMGHQMGTYTLSPQVTLGAAYTNDFFTAAIDADVTSQERFDIEGDETQFVRFGVEANAWGWAQLRAGYEMDLEDTLEDSITAGIGISPFDVVSLDIAASYAGENQFGASTNLAFTF